MVFLFGAHRRVHPGSSGRSTLKLRLSTSLANSRCVRQQPVFNIECKNEKGQRNVAKNRPIASTLHAIMIKLTGGNGCGLRSALPSPEPD
jgi:hypothetical protein